ncbi:hypothetical protein AD947_11430 [Acetobacter tropicalis]|uniref:Uncharacterized protein n=1 Tax=Acetobacter tropicalis TaxID=104102 RepID=A0A149TT55_9PROT|nr:hypothetical protein AD947_11430 [Acetobacter tropicalis]
MAGLLHFFQHHAWKNYVETESDLVLGWEDIDPPVSRRGKRDSTLKAASSSLFETACLTMARNLKES